MLQLGWLCAADSVSRASPPPAGVMPGTPLAAEVLATADRQQRQRHLQQTQQQTQQQSSIDAPAPSPAPVPGV